VPPKLNFFSKENFNQPFDWSLTEKYSKLWRLPQNRSLYFASFYIECIPLWPTYIDEKRTTLGKTYEIKVWCYREHVGGEHIENLRNMIGNTKIFKNAPRPPPPAHTHGPWPPLKIIVQSTK
jgi:hypothetical protein